MLIKTLYSKKRGKYTQYLKNLRNSVKENGKQFERYYTITDIFIFVLFVRFLAIASTLFIRFKRCNGRIRGHKARLEREIQIPLTAIV